MNSRALETRTHAHTHTHTHTHTHLALLPRSTRPRAHTRALARTYTHARNAGTCCRCRSHTSAICTTCGIPMQGAARVVLTHRMTTRLTVSAVEATGTTTMKTIFSQGTRPLSTLPRRHTTRRPRLLSRLAVPRAALSAEPRRQGRCLWMCPRQRQRQPWPWLPWHAAENASRAVALWVRSVRQWLAFLAARSRHSKRLPRRGRSATSRRGSTPSLGPLCHVTNM